MEQKKRKKRNPEREFYSNIILIAIVVLLIVFYFIPAFYNTKYSETNFSVYDVFFQAHIVVVSGDFIGNLKTIISFFVFVFLFAGLIGSAIFYLEKEKYAESTVVYIFLLFFTIYFINGYFLVDTWTLYGLLTVPLMVIENDSFDKYIAITAFTTSFVFIFFFAVISFAIIFEPPFNWDSEWERKEAKRKKERKEERRIKREGIINNIKEFFWTYVEGSKKIKNLENENYQTEQELAEIARQKHNLEISIRQEKKENAKIKEMLKEEKEKNTPLGEMKKMLKEAELIKDEIDREKQGIADLEEELIKEEELDV